MIRILGWIGGITIIIVTAFEAFSVLGKMMDGEAYMFGMQHFLMSVLGVGLPFLLGLMAGSRK